jgi:hypothetical protein
MFSFREAPSLKYEGLPRAGRNGDGGGFRRGPREAQGAYAGAGRMRQSDVRRLIAHGESVCWV